MTRVKRLSLAGLTILILGCLNCSLIIHHKSEHKIHPPEGFEMPAPLVFPWPEDTSSGSDSYGKIDEKPQPISRNPPMYNGKYMPCEGTVIVKMLIGRDGSVVYACVDESSGHTGLDNDALRAVINWKFTPAKYKGEPVQCWIKAPIRFRLE